MEVASIFLFFLESSLFAIWDTICRFLVVLLALYHTNVAYGLLCHYHCLPLVKICKGTSCMPFNGFLGCEFRD